MRLSNTALRVSLGLVFLLTACTPGFQVQSPEPMQTSSQDFEIADDDTLEIEVTFTEPVDLSSIEPRINARLEMETDANASFTVSAGDNDSTVILRTTSEYPPLCVFDADCFFSLHLQGSGESPVESADGVALDGDEDGEPGGDYETTFVLIG